MNNDFELEEPNSEPETDDHQNAAEVAELRRMCDKLMSLSGADAVNGLEMLFLIDISCDLHNSNERSRQVIRQIYERKEREANLRGEKW